MTLIYYKDHRDHWSETDNDQNGNPVNLPVDQQHPLPGQLLVRTIGEREFTELSETDPLPVYLAPDFFGRIRDDYAGENYDTFAFEALAIGGTAGLFTIATWNTGGKPATMATVMVETAAIRVRMDGTAPTATVGTLYPIGSTFAVMGALDIASFQAISQSGVTATLSTHYARRA